MIGKILFVYSEFGAVGPLEELLIDYFEKVGIEYRTTNMQEMNATADEWQPQTVVLFHPWFGDFAEKKAPLMGRLKCHTVLWSMEEPYEIDFVLENAKFFGHILTQDKNSANLLRRSHPHVVHLPHGAMTHIYYPQEVAYQYRSDLCFVGNAYPSRLRFFRQVLPKLKDYRVALIGTGWRCLPDTFGQLVVNSGVSNAEYAKYMNGARVCVNLHRLVDDVPIANKFNVMPTSPNNRFFEIPACRRPQMVDASRLPELNEYYADDEIVVFKDANDFLERFEHLMIHPAECEEIARKGYERTVKDHKWETRITNAFSELV